ncbi:MAG TPA: nitrate- and nitrite sensing domain-containing protein, partial [Micromonospora sp.]
MGSRSSHLRTKVVALLVSLVALWAFAAWVTLRDGLNLLWVSTYDTQISQPLEPLLLELQVERRLSAIYLAKPGSQQREALDGNRHRTEALAAEFKKSAQGWQARLAGSAELNQRIDELAVGLDRLPETRAAIDARTIDRVAAAKAFTEVLDSVFRVFDSLGNLDEADIAQDTATLIQLNRVRELASQEDALLAGALAANKLTAVEHSQFVQLVGAQRFLASEAAARMPDADRKRYDAMVAGAAFSRFQDFEDRVIKDG